MFVVSHGYVNYTNLLSFPVRRVPPQFSIPPPPQHEVMLNSDLNLTCVAIGSPMPYVKWRRGPAQDLTPEDKLPIGRNVLELTDIKESANYTCVAASALGVIEATTFVKVQCMYNTLSVHHVQLSPYFTVCVCVCVCVYI